LSFVADAVRVPSRPKSQHPFPSQETFFPREDAARRNLIYLGEINLLLSAAGGLKIGRSKNDPEWRWIDSYSAIKTDTVNAMFGCYINRPGDAPNFHFMVNGVEQGSFDEAELAGALERWQEIAKLAQVKSQQSPAKLVVADLQAVVAG
jgi:hypothetical protein